MKQKNLILMVVAVGCGLVAAFLTTQINAKGPKVEQVEVLVAAKDLAVGTQFTKAELPKLVAKKMMPKEALPANFVNDENELVDKRLSQAVAADGLFIPSTLSNKGVIILPDGKDMVSIPMSAQDAAGGFVGPGAHVDVLAAVNIKTKIYTFPILIDMQILAVDTKTTYSDKGGAFPSIGTVSLAVTQEEALLISLARQRGCRLSLLLRNPGKPVDPTYNIKKIEQLLQDDSGGGLYPAEGRPQNDIRTDNQSPEGVPSVVITPPTENKPVTVKVFKATGEIAANTEVTKDLIAASFKQFDIDKATADTLQAYQDFTPVLGQVFKFPVAKDQVAINGMIGPPVSKIAPRDEYIPPKPDPEAKPEVKPDPVTPPEPKIKPDPEPKIKPDPKPAPKPAPEKRTHDVPFHTAHGTEIHRYEEFKPGEWRLQRIMTPADVIRESKKQGAGSEGIPSTPDDQTPGNSGRKVD